MGLPQHLTSKFDQIIDYNIKVMGLLAEIAGDIDNPALLAIITSIIGEENGHVRFFTLLRSLAGNDITLSHFTNVNGILHAKPIGTTPLQSPDNQALDIPAPKENPLNNQTHHPGTEEEGIDSLPLNHTHGSVKVVEELPQKKTPKRLIWTFGR